MKRIQSIISLHFLEKNKLLHRQKTYFCHRIQKTINEK